LHKPFLSVTIPVRESIATITPFCKEWQKQIAFLCRKQQGIFIPVTA